MELKYIFRFRTDTLEKEIYDYIKLFPKEEVLFGLIGAIRGKGENIIECIAFDALPFPNLAKMKEKYAVPPKAWYEIVREYIKFKVNNESVRPLGFLHTHPNVVPLPSPLDRDFALTFAREKGNSVMVIIGQLKYIRSFLIANEEITQIETKSKLFRKRKRSIKKKEDS